MFKVFYIFRLTVASSVSVKGNPLKSELHIFQVGIFFLYYSLMHAQMASYTWGNLYDFLAEFKHYCLIPHFSDSYWNLRVIKGVKNWDNLINLIWLIKLKKCLW